jgi:hypothetical protein
MGLGTDVYNGAAGYGKFSVVVGAIVGTIIFLIMFSVGIYLLNYKNDYTQSIKGKVIQNDPTASYMCSTNNNNGTPCYNNTIGYMVNNVDYTFSMIEKYQLPLNSEVELYYDPKDPSKAVLTVPNYKALSIGLLIAAPLLLLLTWVNVYATFKFKTYAAAEGAAGMFNLFRR